MSAEKKQLISCRIAAWHFLTQSEKINATKGVLNSLQTHLSNLQKDINTPNTLNWLLTVNLKEKEATEKIQFLWAHFLSNLELGTSSLPPSYDAEFAIRKIVFLYQQ